MKEFAISMGAYLMAFLLTLGLGVIIDFYKYLFG